MSARTWHSGPPPHVGWWNASRFEGNTVWRWWDGRQWSWNTFSTMPIDDVVKRATTPASQDQASIQWTDYWPKDARVPRVDPSAPPKVTMPRCSEFNRLCVEAMSNTVRFMPVPSRPGR